MTEFSIDPNNSLNLACEFCAKEQKEQKLSAVVHLETGSILILCDNHAQIVVRLGLDATALRWAIGRFLARKFPKEEKPSLLVPDKRIIKPGGVN